MQCKTKNKNKKNVIDEYNKDTDTNNTNKKQTWYNNNNNHGISMTRPWKRKSRQTQQNMQNG